ncbi:hypothetical protein X773_21895 [Mesorhizobium sp. LSJC285A00]|nr:hypothetical protein X773_21895 [Mesorhizobium sp. LSJC285A00]
MLLRRSDLRRCARANDAMRAEAVRRILSLLVDQSTTG